jgi:hypothetical protein
MVEANIRKDRWDKFSIIANFVALALVPIVLGIYGSSINTTLKEKEIRVKYIEIATEILSEKPSPDSRALRSWAIDVIQTYSLVPFSNEAIVELERTALPRKHYLIDDAGNIITNDEGKSVIIE